MSGSAGRALGPAALGVAAVAGLSWAPTFAIDALAAPVLLPLLAVLAADQLTYGNRRAEPLRPILGLVFGAGALLLTLHLVDGASVADVAAGVLDGWRRTLDSTLPARPSAELMAFVPALTLLAGVLGTEWARRGAGPGATVAPGLVLLGLGQLYRAATGWPALAVVAGFGLAAVAVLLADRPRPATRTGTGTARGRPGPGPVALLAAVAVAGLVAAPAVAFGLPGRAAVSVQDHHASRLRPLTTADPLDQVATRLAAGDRPAFRVRSDTPVDRWPLVVLDRFDGANWSSGARLRVLGTELPAPASAAPLAPARAEISDVRLDGPWLPSQARLRTADGLDAWVDPVTGVLVRGEAAPDHYRLGWQDLLVDAPGLTAAAIDQQPVGAVDVAGIPAGITDLARQAVGPDAAPTVQAALVLERWMRDNYQVATGADLPTGHSTAQLLYFLTTSKRGTSEQFATAYALLARSLGVPVRIVVGFRDDGSGTVHDDDVLAWPEIAVTGLGWVPLDPTGGARSSAADRSGLGAATQAARDALPSPDRLATQQPGDPPPAADSAAAASGGLPLWPLGVPAVLAVAAIPALKAARRARRRRAPPRTSVWGAWLDTRDRLRDHGVPVPAGSTVRDVIGSAPVPAADLEALAGCVDGALWAGRDVERANAERAWAAAATIRRGLRTGPWRRRLRAVFATGSLRRRRQPVGQPAPRTG